MHNDNEKIDDSTELDEETLEIACRTAVAQASWVKKRLGLSAVAPTVAEHVAWKDDRIVVIPPEEIVVDENLLKQNGKICLVD